MPTQSFVLPAWAKICILSICGALGLAFGLISSNHEALAQHDEKPAHDQASVQLSYIDDYLAKMEESIQKMDTRQVRIQLDVKEIKTILKNQSHE